MRFEGRIWKDGRQWLAEVPMLDIMTQGLTKREALAMIADAIEGFVNRPSFKVEVFSGSGNTFEVGSTDIAALTALFLQRQRQASGLTLAEVAKRLGVRSANAYARYEQGKSVPTVEKLAQLYSAVNADRDVVIGHSNF